MENRDQERRRVPYNVHDSDSFRVIEGEAELETPDGGKIMLVAGGCLLLHGRVHGHLAGPVALPEVLRRGLIPTGPKAGPRALVPHAGERRGRCRSEAMGVR